MEWTGNWDEPINEVIFLKPCINDTKEPTPCVSDHFKQVNDQFGHKTGDELLKISAKKINSLIKSTDVASRVGGDEFVLLIKDVNRTQMEEVAKRILERFTEPVMINGNRCNVGASIGISVYPDDGVTIDELISKSDEAMYSVKQGGRNNYKIAAEPL